jgi:hypothetical protein
LQFCGGMVEAGTEGGCVGGVEESLGRRLSNLNVDFHFILALSGASVGVSRASLAERARRAC